MARMSRIVAPGAPHHVTQRGNRRQQTFFGDGDYLRYLQLAAEWCAKAEVECWGYCLMFSSGEKTNPLPPPSPCEISLMPSSEINRPFA